LHGHFAWYMFSRALAADLERHRPRGPCISTVLRGSAVAIPFLRLTGSRIRRSTSAGTETGASPIRDLHFEVLEKGLQGRAEEKAGMRKSGSKVVTPRGATRRQFGLRIIM